jgi:hypothetical protein
MSKRTPPCLTQRLDYHATPPDLIRLKERRLTDQRALLLSSLPSLLLPALPCPRRHRQLIDTLPAHAHLPPSRRRGFPDSLEPLQLGRRRVVEAGRGLVDEDVFLVVEDVGAGGEHPCVRKKDGKGFDGRCRERKREKGEGSGWT